MSNQHYNWKRFWCPRSGRINLGDDGYLLNPDTEWGKEYNSDLVIFETISHLPCLALLGEPGIGKTQTLEVEQHEIVNNIQEQGDQVLFLDLRSYGSEDRLIRSLFDSREFKAWQTGAHQLHIFLDSFDECLLRIDTLATLLVDEFKRYQNVVDRLYLRIACRTAIWQPVLEEGLKEIWGENSVGVYELAPLRRIDVIEAAKAKGLSEDDFLQAIDQKDVVPLAIKPITLEFLLNTYRKHNGQFSPEQQLHEFYLKGCKRLCEEMNQSRQASNRTGDFDSHQRLIVAARIAAVTIFANRFAVWTGIAQGDVPIEDVLLQTLCQGYETANGKEFEIKREVIKEVLDTGLFSSRGPHRMGWAHQTYAEFLAAWYLTQHEIPLEKIKNLIFSSEDLDRKLIPQLHETAAWLASMRPDVLEEIIKTDPDVLLRTDVPTDEKVRASIIDSLLKQYEEEKLFDLYRNYRNYNKLKHPGLSEQLRPYLCDSNKRIDARDLAINIAEVCGVSELQDELANLALDSSQSIQLRVSAAKAVGAMGDRETKLKLKPLVLEQLPEDTDDRLKGYALQALWPDQLTAEELFQALTRPKKRNFFGGYQEFLDYEVISKLQPSDLVAALNWLAERGVRCFGHPFEQLGDHLLLKAWEHFKLPGVAESFTQVALVQWREYQKIISHSHSLQTQFQKLLLEDSEKRHTLIEKAVLAISESGQDPLFLYTPLMPLMDNYNFVSEDIFWMLEKLQTSNSETAQKIWAKLIQWSFSHQNTNVREIDSIIEATQTNNVLQNFFKDQLTPIELDSEQAEKLKADHRKIQEMQERSRIIPLDPPPKERVLGCLDNLESGELNAWWQLTGEMTHKPESQRYGDELDLIQLPGWQEADNATQKRIIEGAKQYIQNKEDVDDDWIGTTHVNTPELAGCKAFLLLLQVSPVYLEDLSSEIWQRWHQLFLLSPMALMAQIPEKIIEKLVNLSYQKAKNELVVTLLKLIDSENQKKDTISVIYRLSDQCWDEHLKDQLVEKVKDSQLKPSTFGQLLEKLVEEGSLPRLRNLHKLL